ncbi:hypothetical protein [Pseudomonas aeruginosa]|uniref:hypothetical protein n=1 Tax=Pseudomonas aeruginosa TaxID=287 RepID=UPI00042619DD|nr:hypothetical protein [Pseudomonas aeruginosa]MBT9112205.1 hypothetical protein [Pseudomonas aeruginosa]MEE3595566.1 hypothetical protein [Pseudomonas aeruginosa]HBN9635233.1 hypothetical protein [Pseudomonas aeruginosa]
MTSHYSPKAKPVTSVQLPLLKQCDFDFMMREMRRDSEWMRHQLMQQNSSR